MGLPEFTAQALALLGVEDDLARRVGKHGLRPRKQNKRHSSARAGDSADKASPGRLERIGHPAIVEGPGKGQLFGNGKACNKR